MKSLVASLIIFPIFISSAVCQSWNISLELSDVTCKGANDGQINLIVAGEDEVPDSLYTWQWFGASGSLIDSSSDPVRFLSPGEYTVKVTRKSDSSSISASGIITESDSVLTVTKNVLQQNICAGDAAGIVEARASGGAGGYMYGLAKGTGSSGPTYTKGYADNGGKFQSLPSNNYEVWAIDSRGCEVKTSGFTITQPNPITVVYEVMNAACDDTGGEIVVNSISGGTPFNTNQAGSFNFQTEWRDASNDSLIARNEASIAALPSGVYRLSIKDANACTETIRIRVEQGYKFEIVEARNVSCNFQKDGMIRISLAADNPNVQEPFSIGVTDVNGNDISSLARSNVKSGTVILRDLGPGTYNVKITDALGCIKLQSASLTQPEKLRLEEVIVTDIKCKGTANGEIFFSVSGGSGSYKYSVDSGATFTPNPRVTQLYAGTYNLFVQDDGGCILNAGDVVVREPDTGYHVEEVKVTDVLCNGTNDGIIELFFSDDTSPSHLDEDEDILWMNGNGELIQRGGTVMTDLSEGNYEIKISDDYGCFYNKLIKVNRRYELRADFSMNASRYAVDYPIELIDKSLGEGIVSWLWDFGDGTGSTQKNTSVSYNEPGTYIINLLIENEVGCSVFDRDTLQITKGFSFVVPTAFTPNGDRLNDVFRPVFDNVISMRMRVVNIDGITVYESDDLSASWNGQTRGADQPQGPYYYEILYTTGSGVERKENGKIFLLR